MSFLVIFPPRSTFSTPRTPTLPLGSLARSVHTSIHPPMPLHLASHTGASSMVVFHRSARDSTTPSLNQPQHTPSPSIAFPKLMNGALIHSGRRVISDSTNLCLSPPFVSRSCRFALPPQDLWGGVDNLEPVQRVQIQRDPRPSVDVKLLLSRRQCE